MGERVPAWAESDERYPEREAEWRAAIARAERAEARHATAAAERDTLAAALAEVREIHAALVANDALPREAWSEAADAKHADLSERLDAAMAALPADLAAERFRRERAEALETAADAIERGSVLSQYGAHGWLRARAADERGGR